MSEMNPIQFTKVRCRMFSTAFCGVILWISLVMNSISDEILLTQKLFGCKSVDGKFLVSVELTAGAYSPDDSDKAKIQPPCLFVVIEQPSARKRWDLPVGDVLRNGNTVRLNLEDVLKCKTAGEIAKISDSDVPNFGLFSKICG